MTEIDLWVDPACPWAWITSRWLIEVERVRPINVRYHIMSLAALNAVPLADQLWGPPRVLIAAEQAHGPGVLRLLYDAMGTRVHPAKQGIGPDMIAGALADLFLDPRLALAATSRHYDALVRASHAAGMHPVGQDCGTPVVHVPGPSGKPIAFFGPVLTPTPRDEAAGRLWDGVLAVAGTDGFYELKRTRDRRPHFA